jgi:hypothetical protein
MAHQITIILALFIGGFIGWSLFGCTLFWLIKSREVEIKLIEDISVELRQVKKDIDQLK